MHACMHACKQPTIYVHVCVYVCMRACMPIYMQYNLHVTPQSAHSRLRRLCSHILPPQSLHSYWTRCKHICCEWVRYKYTYICVYICIHMYICMHVCMHVRIHATTLTLIRDKLQTISFAKISLSVCIHSYMCTYVYTCMCNANVGVLLSPLRQ